MIELNIENKSVGSIACLGWGSLVWDSRTLPVSGVWELDGPILPLEFARQSGDGRMTLVIVDGDHRVPVLWSKLNVNTLDEAVEALAEREGVPNPRSIGRWPNTINRGYPFQETISKWANEKCLSGVVWTALKPGMKDQRGILPPLTDVVAHLSALDSKAMALAEEYIRKAPAQISTPQRKNLMQVFKPLSKDVS